MWGRNFKYSSSMMCKKNCILFVYAYNKGEYYFLKIKEKTFYVKIRIRLFSTLFSSTRLANEEELLQQTSSNIQAIGS